ncbi:DNA gyrase subunit A [Brevibacterium sp. NPDC049920]|uniref:DNA gyrase subunit A n=1 Tax=Brevibacterium pityocampae TaxID=506594 RepID=A0ABP8J0X8_9MICO|nr:DNA gyrase subunit A [Nocardia zapadnayensis]
MADDTENTQHIDPDAPLEGNRVEQVDLNLEMQRSYLDYAMSVIVGRALPDVRDGLKPVHRRVLYAMYDGGYRPERSFNKCSRVVGDVMGQYHPHGDTAIYDAMVRLVQPWAMRYPLISGQGNFGSSGNDGAAAPRYTECKMAPLAMEMVRDIEEDTVDFQDNYDGKNQEPIYLPSRFPNLLVNGSAGIAVGMATNIPPHNLREVAAGAQWLLAHPEATNSEALEALLGIIKGPDFPGAATILGRSGIEDAYRTGRGSITQRAVVEVEEIQGRTCLVVTELPYMVNPDTLAAKIASYAKDGKVAGIADMRDESSGRTGQRLVIVLKRDAVAKVVLNNLYKHTQLQDNFSANMLALVDNVPRTLSLDAFLRLWVKHQIDVIVRRTRYRLRKAEERAHILRGYLKALNALDEVIALIRRSPSSDEARTGLMELLDVDEIQANAILDLQLRRLAALERLKIEEEATKIEQQIKEYNHILETPAKQREIVSTELDEIVERYGDDRRTRILAGFDGDVSMEDLIPEEEVVVTITRGGYAKRTQSALYRAQHRGGKGITGARLRGDDVVDHFFVTSTHNWLLFFTNTGRVYRAKAYELPEGSRDAKGQHVANLLALQPGETIAQVLSIRDYEEQDYLVLATRSGLVKKTRLAEYDSNRTGGVIAVNLREMADGTPDELVSARLVSAEDHLLLVSRKGMSIRFKADDATIRATGRATSGVTGMKFKGDDTLLTMDVMTQDTYVFVVTEAGFAKRTPIDEYRIQGRGGYGIKVAKITEQRGDLVGGLIVADGEEVLVVMERGKVVRSSIDEVPAKGRNTMGVVFAKPGKNDRIIAVTRGPEQAVEDEAQTPVDEATVEAAVDALDPSDPASTASESEDQQ